MTLLLRVLTVLAGGLLPLHAHGNGVTASFAAGGVEFKDSTDIAIAREDLFLSPDEVRVDYVFHSTSDAPRTETIAFPLPRVPADLESSPAGDALTHPDRVSDDIRNYLDFSIAANDQPITPVLHEFAWLGDKDVSAAIRAAGLPLMPRYEQWVKATAQLDAMTLQSLVASGLVQVHGTVADPAWEYQAIYEWQQAFAVGDTTVSVRYRPLLGWPGDYGIEEFHLGPSASTACVDDALRQKIAEVMRSNGAYQVARLDYITTSARHWSGPIRKFNLAVGAPGDMDDGPTLAAVCPAVTSLDENGIQRWAASNYVPEQDIHVTFYVFPPAD